MNRLLYLTQRDTNSLDFVRFVAAVVVILSHSYLQDPIGPLTNNQIYIGRSAVAVFFITSGFLITMSIDRTQDWAAYIKARFLRIYPALIVVVTLTVFVLGPLMTSLSLRDYFTNPQTYGYYKVLFLYHIVYTLPGVFGSSSRFGNEVNTSLWTLWYEVLSYALVLGLWAVHLLRKRFVLLMFCGLVIGNLFFVGLYPWLNIHNSFLDLIYRMYNIDPFYTLSELEMYFMGGMVFYLYRDKIPMKRSLFVLSMLGLLIIPLVPVGLYKPWCATLGTYALFYLASSQRSPFKRFSKYGDFSYGLYIYSFPIQQCLVQIFGAGLPQMVNFVLGFLITLPFAILSWHFVEKPALKLKNVQLRFFSRAAVKDV